jgi:general secretion pathway protein G
MGRPTTPGKTGSGNAGARAPGRRSRAAGFTLIELITVVAIIGILAAIAMPQFKISIIQAKEAVLRENLFRMRDVIDQYYVDNGKYPESIEALKEKGYLREIPKDPMTGSREWTAVPAEPDPERPNEEPGIFDVKSMSEGVGLNGEAYNTW